MVIREQPTARARGTRRGVSTSGAIDCDVHPGFREGAWDLKPYLDTYWQARIGIIDPKGSGTGGSQGFKFPPPPWLRMPAYPGSPALRADCVPPSGGRPGTDPAYMIEDLLDRYDLAAAILIGQDIRGIGGIPDPDLAAALAAAHNDWTSEVWLSADPRFKGSITVAPQDVALAIKEVERWAEDRRMVQILVVQSDRLLGKRHFWPLYEVAEHHGLPVAIHPGGEGAGLNSPMSPLEPPTYFMEFHTGVPQAYQAQIISLVAEGVFERFPGLRVALVEGGFSWLPGVMWRMDKNWRALRDEVPWVRRPPSEYMIEHVRVTSQPLYEPADPKHLDYLMEMMHADRTLMFATDYPHWDGDDPEVAFRKVPGSVRDRILRETPREFYSRIP